MSNPALSESIGEHSPSTADTYDRFSGSGNPIYVEPGDEVIALQEMVVRTPEDPVLINGDPYMIEVDGNKLAQVINRMRQRGDTPKHHDPRVLAISLGPSLNPKIARDESNNFNYSWENNAVELEIPAEITDHTAETEEIVGLSEEYLNEMFARAINQNERFKDLIGSAKFRFFGGIATGAVIAEGISVAATNDQDLVDKIILIGSGPIIGAVVATSLFIVKNKIELKRHGGESAWSMSLEKAAQKAEKKANEATRESVVEGPYSLFVDKNGDPIKIISLVPFEESEK